MFGVRGALVLVAILPFTAAGQGREAVWVSGAVVFLDFQGIDFTGMSGAPGFELQVRYRTVGRGASAAAGYHWTRHSVSGPMLRVQGLFFEPRYSFGTDSSGVAPYVSGRYSHLMLLGSTYVSGMSFGVGGGLVWKIAPAVEVDAATGVAALYFPATTYSYPGGGTSWMLRVGIAAGL